MMWFIWGMLFPACLTAFYLLLRRCSRDLGGDLRVARARDQFRLQREWLEARFLSALGRDDPIERLRWDEAQWHDEVVWARDRQTHRFLALIGVHFEPEPFETEFEPDATPLHHATVIFEHAHGRWRTDGLRLDEVYPHEAFLTYRRLEPVVVAPPHRRP